MPFAGDTLFPESIPLADWRVVSDKSKLFLERKTGHKVMCRFVQYEQTMPRRLEQGIAN